MKKLENFIRDDKWLNDYEFDSADIQTQLMVVDAEEVQAKLIELNTEIELLKLTLSEFKKDKNWTRSFNCHGILLREHALYIPKLNKAN